MKKIFLYRLLKHSPVAFVLVLLFLGFYTVTFYKKMDMAFFPYNNMYAIDFTNTMASSTYAMKLNGELIKITDNRYWKKDLLETSLYAYARYMLHNRKVFMDDYINYRFHNEQVRDILLKGLTPDTEAAVNWPRWYIRFSGYKIPANASLELMQYNFNYDTGRAVLKDSVSIYNTILP